MSHQPDTPTQPASGPQVDFGSTWSDPDPDSNRQWRVSWDPSTSELTSTPTDGVGDARLLGRLPTRAEVDGALSGWASACVAGNDATWVANRVSTWFAPRLKNEVDANESVHDRLSDRSAPEPERADHLPAAPVARVLADYQADFGDADTGMFARGLGLDEELVDDIIGGRVATLNIGQIAAVCEGLWASPYDLWDPDEARTVLHAYGPERWPRTILPIDEPTPRRPADTFMARRLDQQAAEIVDNVIRRSTPPIADRHLHAVADAGAGVTATAYSITGILAVDQHGRISEPSPRNIADPNVEYHFQFTPVGRRDPDDGKPSLGVSIDQIAAGPPPGQSVHPALAAAAESLRTNECQRADMIRFTAQDGQEAWVGWDPDAQTWDAWDDPRDHFAGPGEMIIEASPPALTERPPRLEPRLHL